MTIRDLIPWNRGRDVAVHRGERANPLLTLHREMNRVFDDVFRGFDMAPFGSNRLFDRALGWSFVPCPFRWRHGPETKKATLSGDLQKPHEIRGLSWLRGLATPDLRD